MDPNSMDAELASIVSSLSALSNPGLSQQQYSHGFSNNNNNNNSNNNNNNNNNNKQLGGFRSSSLTLSDNESDLLSQGSTSYLDQNINNTYNTGFGLGSFGYNKQTAYSVGTAPPYVSTYATNTQHNNNNINTNNTGLYVNTNNSSSTQLRNKLSLLDTYSNNLNMNTLNSNDLNSSFNSHNNYNTVNNFSNTNLSYDKENYYAHTIQNITSSATSTTGFFEKFGKSLIEGTKELENEDSTPTTVNTTVNTSANDRMDNEYLNTTNNNTSATNLTNQNVWNQSTVPSFQLQNSAMVDNETSSQNSNINTNTNNTNTNEPNMNDNPEGLQKNDQMKSPPFFFNHSILNNGFLYGNNFSQFPLGSPTSFIPQMFYPLGQHPSIPPQIPPNNNSNNQMNNTGIRNPTNINHNKNNTTIGTTSITATIDNNGNNNVPSSIPDYSLPVNNKNLIESNIPIINNINNIDTNDTLHDSNNMGLQGVPMIFTSPSSKPVTLNMNHHHSQKLQQQQQQHPNKTTTVNKHPRSKNNNSNNNINNDIKKGNLFNSQQIPNTNHITINPGNPYLDPHNTTVTPNFISKLNENTFNRNLDIDESTKHKTTIPSQQNPGYHRSPLLEEIRNNVDNKYTLKDIVGHTLEFCKDQYGSRFIQKELATAEPSEKEVVFNELRDHILTLSNDVFGNYVIQKFFEYGTPTQKSILVENFKDRMKELSVQMYACRVIQKALEFIKPEERIELVVELSDCVLKMIKDQNGNHVIQKAIECIPIELLPFVLNSLIGHIYHLSTHSYGCRVIQRLLEFGTIKDQTVILDELKNFIPYLLQDQYGNYVIQHILQHGSDDANCLPMINTKQEIIDIVADNVVEFSKHKFASNVVEKAILYGTKEQKNSIISRILPRDNEHAANLEDNAPLILMMKDQFANYVVQKLVTVSEGESKILIVTAIRAYVDKLNNTNALGNRHLASVEKLAALVETIKV